MNSVPLTAQDSPRTDSKNTGMNGSFKAFFLGLGAATFVGLLFDLSQRKYSQLAFDEGWLVGYRHARKAPNHESAQRP